MHDRELSSQVLCNMRKLQSEIVHVEGICNHIKQQSRIAVRAWWWRIAGCTWACALAAYEFVRRKWRPILLSDHKTEREIIHKCTDPGDSGDGLCSLCICVRFRACPPFLPASAEDFAVMFALRYCHASAISTLWLMSIVATGTLRCFAESLVRETVAHGLPAEATLVNVIMVVEHLAVVTE